MRYQDNLIFEGYLKGLAAGKSLEDIAKKHNVSLVDLKSQLEKGIKVEHEHTSNADIAEKIALDHLFEDPHYYTKLAKIEKKENEEYTAQEYAKDMEKDFPSQKLEQDDEMPYPEFAKLSKHASPKSSKEIELTDKEIHDLAKQDSREEEAESNLPTLRQFYKELDTHDYYYQYSDDHSVYSHGQRQEDYLRGVAEQGGPSYQSLYKQMVAYHTRPQGSTMKKPEMPELSNVDRRRYEEVQNTINRELEGVQDKIFGKLDADWLDSRSIKEMRNRAESILDRIKELAVQKNIKL